jgi:hypothetical protein
MISTETRNVPSQRTSATPCGCAEPDQGSCGLECNEKPRFSCGQLLTDQDLTALLKWSETKSALARFRHGWGVACGLDVYAGLQDGQVNVGPGYAMDGCGRDIVVCGETTVNLDGCCKPEPAPCPGVVDAPAPTVNAEFAGIEAQDLRIVDLVLHYAEVDGSPRAALGGVNCAAGSRCEYSRTQETCRIDCVPGTADGDPLRLQAEKWEEGYRACLHVLKRYREESDKARGAEIRHWLSRWLERHPLRQFGFVHDWVSHKPADEWDEKDAVQALFWIVQDCRNAYLNSGCPQAQDADGVPIARLWVRLPEPGATKAKCRVIAIDTQPPFRRYMRSHAWPSPLPSLNVARVIWRRIEEAQSMLVGLGMRTREPDGFQLPHTVEALEKELEAGKVMLAVDSVAKLRYLDAGSLGFRVIGVAG